MAVPQVPEARRLLLAPLELQGFFKCVMRFGYMERVEQVRKQQLYGRMAAAGGARQHGGSGSQKGRESGILCAQCVCCAIQMLY